MDDYEVYLKWLDLQEIEPERLSYKSEKILLSHYDDEKKHNSFYYERAKTFIETKED